MFDHHAIVAFVGETAAIVQDVSSGFDPIVTTRACKIGSREESLPIFPNRSMVQDSSSGSSAKRY